MIQQSPTERTACPFCGNSHVQLTSIRDGYEAWCKCGASMTACNPDSRNKVIAKWDARAVLASQAAQPAEADGVERALLDELATYLPSIRVFLTSKERPHEAGVKWHDDLVAKINAAREARHV